MFRSWWFLLLFFRNLAGNFVKSMVYYVFNSWTLVLHLDFDSMRNYHWMHVLTMCAALIENLDCFLFAEVEEKSCWVGVWAGGVCFYPFLLINADVFLIYSSCVVNVYLHRLHAHAFLSVRIFSLNSVCLFACLCKCVCPRMHFSSVNTVNVTVSFSSALVSMVS